MPITIQCPTCSARYQVNESAQGKRVQCQKCQTTFAAHPEQPFPGTPSSVTDPFGDLYSSSGGVDLAQSAATGRSTLPRKGRIENPSGGPTDIQMRLGSGGMILAGLILFVASTAMNAANGSVYLMAIVLSPLAIVLGIAGVISPNVIRSLGKYGGHLPAYYRVIGFGVVVLGLVLMVLMFSGFFFGGFQLAGANSGTKIPGLSRSQKAKVLETIRKSYESSPNAGVVRNVSFNIWQIQGADPIAAGEQVLSDVPGYVPGSLQITPDQKKLKFQYKGEKEIGQQYALLLPQRMGIFMDLTPQFEE